MNMRNNDIRNVAFQNNVKMYQIAEKLEIHYVTLNNKLRKELSMDDKQKIFKIINELTNKEENYE